MRLATEAATIGTFDSGAGGVSCPAVSVQHVDPEPELDLAGTESESLMSLGILNRDNTSPLLKKTSDKPDETVKLLLGLMDKRNYPPPREAVAAWVQALYREIGSWKAVGRIAAIGTGRNYSNPERTAQAWGQADGMPAADVVVALQRAVPHIRLDDYALAEIGEEPRAAQEREIFARLDTELDLLRAQMAEERTEAARLRDAFVAFAHDAGSRLGVDFDALVASLNRPATREEPEAEAEDRSAGAPPD